MTWADDPRVKATRTIYRLLLDALDDNKDGISRTADERQVITMKAIYAMHIVDKSVETEYLTTETK